MRTHFPSSRECCLGTGFTNAPISGLLGTNRQIEPFARISQSPSKGGRRAALEAPVRHYRTRGTKAKLALAPILVHLDAVLNPNELRVAVHFKAKSENAEQLRQRLLGMLTPTRAEDGCILFELHQVEGSPDEFFVFERWASTEAHRKHSKTAHLQDLIAIVPKLVAQPVVGYHLKQIG